MIALLAAAALCAAAPARVLDVPGFGAVELFGSAGRPARLVVVLSGAGGVEDGARALAADLAADGALAALVDTPRYLAGRDAARCVYPAGDLEALAQHVEKVIGFDAYARPLLVGHSRGAALAWAAIAQAPAGTFAGAVGIAPCPGKPLALRLCAGSGPPPRVLGTGELPALAPPPAPLALVSGANDGVCPPAASEALAASLGAPFTRVEGADHGLAASVIAAATGAARRIRAADAQRPAAPSPAVAAVADLPLVEVPARAAGARLAVLLSGDGGWVGIDKALASALADAGVAVVGLDSLRYFWRRRTPEETARDLARVVAHYRAAWGRGEVILAGYSRGADVLAIVAARLPAEERARVRLVALLGPGTFAELEVHAIDLLSTPRRAAALPTEEALRATAGTVRVLCVEGADEKDSLCPRLADLQWVKRVVFPGGHHFGGGYGEIAAAILEAARGHP